MNPEDLNDAETAVVLMIMGVLMKKKRKIWSKQWLLRRKEKGCYENLMRELALEDAEGYRGWLRMDTQSFEFLLELVSPLISRKNTNMRKAISAGDKLALTLRYLASGETQHSLALQFRIAQNTISGILKLVCSALVTVLSSYLQTPSTEAEWHSVSEQFKNMFQFPMCIGALAGKHVKISPSGKCGPMYYHYKRDLQSIVFMALVDANLKFLFVDVSINDQMHDNKIWAKCKLKYALEKNFIRIPKAQCLPNTQTKVPYVIVADNTFPLMFNLMKPFPDRNVNEEKIFNYRLSRAQRVSENAFGILAARFQIFKDRILTDPINATKIVLACCSLHNFLLDKNSTIYFPDSSIDVEDIDNKTIRLGDWRDFPSNALVPLEKYKKNSGELAKNVRKLFCTYFNSIGAVPWQNEMYV